MPDTRRPGTRRPGHTYCPMRSRWLLVFGNTLGRLWSVAGARGELAEVMITIVGDHALYSYGTFSQGSPLALVLCARVYVWRVLGVVHRSLARKLDTVPCVRAP